MQTYLIIFFQITIFQDKEAEESEKGKEKSLAKIQEQEEGSEDEDKDSMVTQSTTPMITSVQYNKYVLSLIKLLVGERTLNDWVRKGNGSHCFLSVCSFTWLVKWRILNNACMEII